MKNGRKNISTVVAVGFGIGLGWLAATARPMSDAQADERRTQPPVAFKSGGERSAEILEQISKQITTLDQRLARIETAVVGTAPKNKQ